MKQDGKKKPDQDKQEGPSEDPTSASPGIRNTGTDGSDAGEGGSEDSGSGVVTEQDAQVERPRLYKVLLHNDDYTPMEFVIEVLERFFSKTHAQATEIMLAVHYKGSGTCGVFPYEIAETKVSQVTEAAREAEFPLQCTLERV